LQDRPLDAIVAVQSSQTHNAGGLGLAAYCIATKASQIGAVHAPMTLAPSLRACWIH